ncbi:MAG: type 4a pilus biogenesis protein PilO [Candidatus Omnitrophica bacterium]|nr:type 4a pilus biogenesis protein PilO [Candidatus Omnitrophota bacterium]
MELTVLVDKHKNKLLNIAVIILALILTYNIYKQYLADKASLEQKKEMELKKRTALENISQLELKIQSYQNLLSEKGASVLINNINSLAKDSGVKIISVRPAEKVQEEEYIKFPFELVINAPSYHAVGNFVSKLESSPEVFLVEVVKIRQDSGEKSLSADLRVTNIVLGNKK